MKFYDLIFLSLQLTVIIIPFVNSVELECRALKRKTVCLNNNINIVEKGTEIETKDDTSYTILFFKDTVVKFLPLKLSNSFKDLHVLKVYNSSLSEIEKSNFEGLEKIEELNFGQNSLTKLPNDAFELLPILEKIYLDRNGILGIPPTIFSKNTKLTEISLANNKIAILSDQTFKNLVNLKFIFISHNNIEDLRSGTFDDCVELEEISIAYNKLKYVPENIFEKNKKLKFSFKNFENNICIDSYCIKNNLSKLDELKTAFRQDCRPPNQDLIDELIEKVEKLKSEIEILEGVSKKLENKKEELTKMEQKLEEAESTISEKTEKIEKLEKENDDLERDVDELKIKVKDLETELETKNKDQLTSEGKNEELKTTIKNKNTEINELKKEKQVLIELHEKCAIEKRNLTLINDNEAAARNSALYKQINSLEKELEEQKTFKETYRNQVEIANKTIDGLKNGSGPVEQQVPSYNIDCKFSQIEFQSEKYFSCAVNNLKISTCGAKLKEISGNPNGKTVTGIKISDSSFVDFPVALPKKFEDLKLLEILKSRFSNFNENICEISKEIEKISVESSNIGDFVRLDECESLETLRIEDSRIRNIYAENQIKSLTDLILRKNDIEEISQEFFGKFKNLKNVQLSENKITSLNARIFDENKNLETVNFADNPIKRVDAKIFAKNSELSKVNFKNLKCISNTAYTKGDIEALMEEVGKKC